MRLFAAVLGLLLFAAPQVRAADPAFQNFLQSTWPEAQQLGVSRATLYRNLRKS